jgi:hypothetical protein
MKLCLLPLLAIAAQAADIQPTQIHLALAGDDGIGNSNGITLSYQTVEDADTVAYFSVDAGDLEDVSTVMRVAVFKCNEGWGRKRAEGEQEDREMNLES